MMCVTVVVTYRAKQVTCLVLLRSSLHKSLVPLLEKKKPPVADKFQLHSKVYSRTTAKIVKEVKSSIFIVIFHSHFG
jgi:hypothetical protein